MTRMLNKTRLLSLLAAVLLVVVVLGCGSSTRNDQGTSFTFFGWFLDTTGTVGVTTLSAPIAGPNPETGGFGADVIAYAGLQNNLMGQFIRIERIFHRFTVPGSTLRIPDTSVGVPGTLAAAGPSDGSSLPEGTNSFGEGGNVGYFGALVVPRSVREFIALNRSAFPEPPFVMVVSSYASGVTSAGNRMNSNRLEIEVIFDPEIVIPPTLGEDDDTTEESAFTDETDEEDNVFEE